ncbi:MAG: 5-formyltetrahydrofolate cyclo-ligase [Deferribacteraceae bacterium]|jgi:5-formyltetrahydrofolate cyclo-ligase|nr:5-formyltetrahydrofolate cyclo-ligase [Deferribacteraceae bacterium]
MNKQTLRSSMLSQRAALDKAAIDVASQQIAKVFLDRYGQYESFLLYSPVRGEVDAAYIAQELWQAGKTVFYPRVAGESLLLGVCKSFDDLEAGYKGILEPKLANIINCKHIDVAVIPALAFDTDNYRLGYGKGFYDRFLAAITIAHKVGIAYRWQIVDTVYPETHDQRVDTVIVY